MTERAGRTVANVHATPYHEYDMEGPLQPDISWLPISYDAATGQGTYMFRMEPGATTIAHDHRGMEEFLVLEGDLVDDDGTEFGPGDFVSYDHGTHSSRTRNGCLIVVFEWQRPDGDATSAG
jgi:quercetin dioxygenase-like cupin family protein